MIKESNQKRGFLLWFDFAKAEKHNIDLISRPKLLPYLPSASEKLSAKSKKVVEAAKDIASVASTVLYNVKHRLLDRSRNPELSIVDVTSDFQRRVLSVEEFAWYSERNSWEKVISHSKSS